MTALASLLVGLTVAGGLALALGHGLVSERRTAAPAPAAVVPAAVLPAGTPVEGARLARAEPGDPALPVFLRRTVPAVPAGAGPRGGATEPARPEAVLPERAAPMRPAFPGSALQPRGDGPELVSIDLPRLAARPDAAADMAPPPRPPFRHEAAAGYPLPEEVDSAHYLIGVYR
ncbi:hypothetical protein [Rhodovulum sp. MB263]|uniref:hypothetical protein n=1 Tax=Rhodovulum sp. (strain MB263) TaxID=308754 RepID=UPI0009B74907|nr:hypothetical protein [Rhodovulum sp. MB263]ARC90739.1 hypothetical protein B5V46_18855 [Rhodovulum sp. MB263]